MPRFEPFAALRFSPDVAPLPRVTAPPYDVIDPAERAELVARHPCNIVQVDLPDEADGPGRYDAAARRFESWRDEGVIVADERPSFTVYRMGYTDDLGRPRRTVGVFGALELSRPGEAGILPHEHTTPKAKSDRLDLLRATGVNLSAVWGLSLTRGLSSSLTSEEEPLASWADEDGIHHAVWRVDEPGRVAAIAAAVGQSPVVIADGHHRYETSLAYRDERRAAGGSGGAELALTYVVELVDDELTVRPIHRLLSGFPPGFDLLAALEPWFEPAGSVNDDSGVLAAMQEAGALAVVTPEGDVTLVRPRPEALGDADDLDSSRLGVALAALDQHRIVYQHGVDHIRAAVESGRAQFGVLLRPATVAQIEANAHAGRRMPPKTTFFHPKPKTGLVFRDTR